MRGGEGVEGVDYEEGLCGGGLLVVGFLFGRWAGWEDV